MTAFADSLCYVSWALSAVSATFHQVPVDFYTSLSRRLQNQATLLILRTEISQKESCRCHVLTPLTPPGWIRAVAVSGVNITREALQFIPFIPVL